jgi:hypothetical protein
MRSQIRRCSTATSPCATDRARRRQSGQVTIEFGLALLLLVVGLAALYQALHFELDAFNRLLILRQRAFHEAHLEQDKTPKTFFNVQQEFKTIGELPSMPFIQTDPSLTWGPRRYYFRKGTRYYDFFDTTFMHSTGWITLEMTAGDLWEDSVRWRTPFTVLDGSLVVAYTDPLDQ